MNEHPLAQFNRFALVLAALIVIFGAALVLLLAWGAPDETITRVADFAGYLRRHNDRETKIIISLAATVVVLLMFTAIIIELTPAPAQNVRVRSMKSGDAAITTSQIAARINAEVADVPHVAECAAQVAARGGGKVEVSLELYVDADANLAETADEACRRAQVLVEQQLGIDLAARPRARLHYRELRLGDAGATHAASSRSPSGWERPHGPEGELDQRG